MDEQDFRYAEMQPLWRGDQKSGDFFFYANPIINPHIVNYYFGNEKRDDDLREGFSVPHDHFLKSINSSAPCCESYFYFLLIEAPTSRYSN